MRRRIRLPLFVLLAALPSATALPLRAQGTVGETIDIFYDEHMVPHVLGETDRAAFYGLGFHHMLEYPIGTLNQLWRFSGRMAEIAGDSYLDEDRVLRLWEVPEIAERHEVELREEGLYPLLRAYVEGIEAGRAWWRDGGDPADSSRLDALLGNGLEVFVDRAPDFLNSAFSPYGPYNDPQLPTKIRNVVDRLFAEDQPITVPHVLRLGVVINSFFMLKSNEVPVNVLGGAPPPPPPDEPTLFPRDPDPTENSEALASNGWMVSPAANANGDVITLTDAHVGLNRLQLRPYIAQIKGKRYQATGLTMPGYPGVYIGFNDHFSWVFTAPTGDPVARNRWQVTLESAVDPEDLKFQFQHDSGTDLVELEKVQETLQFFDPVTKTLNPFQNTRYYVPVHASEGNQGFARYPVISPVVAPPLPGEDVQFSQAGFVVEANVWEFTMKMGRARNVRGDLDALLSEAMLIFGNGVNLMAADQNGDFRYVQMGRYPVQGPSVPASQYSEGAVLDGSQLGWRWQGFHTLEDLPRIGPADVSASHEVWVQNNVTPDLIEAVRFQEADLLNYPAYMVPHASETTWRQVRADELIRIGAPSVDREDSEAAAYDRTDTWMHLTWPFFELAASLYTTIPVGSADVAQFVSWTNAYRDHDENDLPDPSHDFVAHPFSQVTVYATLLRSHYLAELWDLHQQGLMMGAGLTPLQLAFGQDPVHPLYGDPGPFTGGGYDPNIDAMQTALQTVADLWVEGAAALGLDNQGWLAAESAQIPGDPWSDPRYDEDLEPPWDALIAGDKMTRWGHLSITTLTPHYLPPPKREVVSGGADPPTIFAGYLYTGLRPPLLQGLPYDGLKIPFYAHPAAVWPVPGVEGSLFFTRHKKVHLDPIPKGYQESVYEWSTGGSFDFHPQTSGSQTLLSVALDQFNDGSASAARGRFLLAVGGTEITVPDLLGDGLLDYQERFAPTQDFVDGNWNTLHTTRAALGTPQHTLRYLPRKVQPEKPQAGAEPPPLGER